MIRKLSPAELARQPAEPPFSVRPAPSPDAGARERWPARELAQQLHRFLAEELALCPERIRGVVERELARFQGAKEVALRVHPDDLALLPEARELAARHELAGTLAIVAERALTQGGCVISSEAGEVDARVETRIARALSELTRGDP